MKRTGTKTETSRLSVLNSLLSFCIMLSGKLCCLFSMLVFWVLSNRGFGLNQWIQESGVWVCRLRFVRMAPRFLLTAS